jgi:hypothetical protein
VLYRKYYDKRTVLSIANLMDFDQANSYSIHTPTISYFKPKNHPVLAPLEPNGDLGKSLTL